MRCNYRIATIYLFFCAIILLACDEKQEVSIEPIPIIQVTDYFNEHFAPVSVVPIETTETFLLSDVDKVIAVGDDYLVLSKNVDTVALIDGNTGKVKCWIHRIGNGPGEYRKIVDVAYDDENRHIVVMNDYQRLQFYDLEGNFLYQKEVNDSFENLSYADTCLYMQNPLNGYACYPYKFTTINLSDGSVEKWGNSKSIEFPIRSRGCHMLHSRRLLFSAPLDFTIYRADKNGYEALYNIGYPTDKFTDDFLELSVNDPMEFFKRVSSEKIVYSINTIRETEKHVVFRNNRNELCFLNKEANKVYADGFILWDFFCLSPQEYVPFEGNSNTLLFTVSAEKLLKELKTCDVQDEEILKVVREQGINTDDNPILIVFQEQLVDKSILK